MLANWPQSEAIPRAFQVGSEGQPHHHMITSEQKAGRQKLRKALVLFES